MPKTFKISDLFITDWLDADKKPALTSKEMMQIIDYRDKMKQAIRNKAHGAAGFYGIMILKALSIDKKTVAKFNIDQTVDCVNDLAFLHKPWYFFPLPSFSANGKNYEPPADKMEDRSFEQLVHADAAFSKYCITDYQDRHAIPSMDPSIRAEAYIDDLISILYQTPETFSDKTIDAESKSIAYEVTSADKALILHTYANIREYIVEMHPDLFPRGEDPEPDEEERFPVYTGKQWIDLMFDLAESPVFPSLEKASKAEIYKALYWLNKKAGEIKTNRTHAES